MSPTSPRIIAAVAVPTPLMSVKVVPVAATAVLIRFVELLELAVQATTSSIRSAASCRRVRPAMSRGRTVASSALALVGGQIPSRASRNQLHQQLVQVVHRLGAGPDQVAAPLAHQPQRDHLVVGHHRRCADRGCAARPPRPCGHRAGSFLRPCPTSKIRARVDSFGGTSSTVSPSATSRCASCPRPRRRPRPPRSAAATAAPAGASPGSRRCRCRPATPPAALSRRRAPPSRATASPGPHRSSPLPSRSSIRSIGWRVRADLPRAKQTPLEPRPARRRPARTHPAREPHNIVGRHLSSDSPTT